MQDNQSSLSSLDPISRSPFSESVNLLERFPSGLVPLGGTPLRGTSPLPKDTDEHADTHGSLQRANQESGYESLHLRLTKLEMSMQACSEQMLKQEQLEAKIVEFEATALMSMQAKLMEFEARLCHLEGPKRSPRASTTEAEFDVCNRAIRSLEQRLLSMNTVDSGQPMFTVHRSADFKHMHTLAIAGSSLTNPMDFLGGEDFEQSEQLLGMENMNWIDALAETEKVSPEYAEIVKNALVDYDMNLDVWSAATLVIVKDLPDMIARDSDQEGVLRLGLVLVVLIVNLILQLSFVYWITQNVLLFRVASMQQEYRRFHSQAFISGQFDQQTFDSLGQLRSSLCKLSMSQPLFMSACIFLWASRCVNEFRMISRVQEELGNLPSLPPGVSTAHMAHETRERIGNSLVEVKIQIVCLNRSTKWWLYTFIIIPRYIIASVLLAMGTAFLTATESFTDLILNSLAMAFIYDIDELLLKVFLPNRLRKILNYTKISSPPPTKLLKTDVRGLVARSYRKSLLALVVTIASIFLWLYLQPILPGYKWDVHSACQSFLQEKKEIVCPPWTRNCFPT